MLVNINIMSGVFGPIQTTFQSSHEIKIFNDSLIPYFQVRLLMQRATQQHLLPQLGVNIQSEEATEGLEALQGAEEEPEVELETLATGHQLVKS